MPIHLGKDSKGPFVQWGHQKKYHYKANDKQSLANAKSRTKKQMKAIFSSGYIGQDIQENNIIIQQIKNKLLNIFHKKTWKQFIDSQKYGDCQKIACYAAQLFPTIQIIEVEQNFCQEAINKLHNLNDNGQMYGSHFINKINNKYYDFGKGTNTILNIYLIGTQIQKYKVQLEENQLNCFQKSYNRTVFPKYQLKKNVPQYLYHATYRPLLRKIKQLGLGNTKRTYWQDSKPGVVYLADDPDVAESYADTNQNLRNEDWLDEIVVLQINTDLLDKTKLFVDQNVKLDEGQINATWQYHGIIPWQNIKIFQQNSIYQSKFDQIYSQILLETYDPNSAIIKICIEENLCETVYNYYQEYYKTYQNNRQKADLGWVTKDFQPVIQQPKRPHDMLMQDLQNLKYSAGDFREIGYMINEKIKYFICLDKGYLVGVIKYWLSTESAKGNPVIGYININNNFKHQQYGIALLDACFKYHKENFPDKILFVTKFSDEGKLYAKHICQRLAQKYGIEIFVTDDLRYLQEEVLYKSKWPREYTFKPTQKILNLIKK